MLALGGAVVELEPHLARLATSVRELYGMPVPEGARALVNEAAGSMSNGRVRITVAPGDHELKTEVTSAPVDPAGVLPPWEAAQVLSPIASRWAAGRHKWADRSVLARLEADAAPMLPLLVDSEGLVLEASRATDFAFCAVPLAHTMMSPDFQVASASTRGTWVCSYTVPASLANPLGWKIPIDN